MSALSEHTGSNPRRVVFIGGLDDGRMAVEELLKHPRVQLVGAFVLNDADGASVSGFRTFDDLVAPDVLKKVSRIKDAAEDVRALTPVIIFVVGFSQLIPKSILSIPPFGVVGFHSAPLPERRGCSPLIWAIAEGL